MSLAFGTRHACDRTSEAQQASAASCPERDRPWVLAASVLGSSLAFIEGSVVNLALPAVQLDLGLGSVEVQWIVNSYLLMLGSLLLIGGAAGDRFGLKLVYIAGLALFGGASLGCALAPDYPWLVAARLLQGIGAAMLVPTSLALINVHFDRRGRARAIGIWAGASALTTALGPVIGGGLVDHFGWRAVFLVIVPPALAAIGVARWRIPTSARSDTGTLDWPGALLLAASLIPLTLALIDPGVSLRTAVMIGLSLFAMAAFLSREAKASTPMMPLSLFRNLEFSGANAMTLALYFSLAGALYFVPFNLIQVQGYSALAAGAAFLPMTLLLGLGSAFAGDLLNRIPPRHMLTAGALLAAAGFALLALPGSETDYLRDWLPGIVVIGLGMTLCVAPLTTVVMAAIESRHSGVASGVNNTAARLAGVLSIALLTGIAVNQFTGDLASRLDALPLPGEARRALLDNGHRLAELATTSALAETDAVRRAIHASYVATFRRLMIVCATGAAVASILAWFTLTRFATASNHGPDDPS